LPFNYFSQIEKSASNNWSENWISTIIKLKINDSWKIGLEEQFRLKYIDDNFDRNFLELKVQRKFNQSFSKYSIGGSYRYLFINDDKGRNQSIERHNRFSYFLSQKFKLNRFYFKNRIQYQSREEIFSEKDSDIYKPNKYWRFKSTIAYNFKNWKLDPALSFEYFSRNKKHYWNQYNKYRIAIGSEYSLKKKHQISFRYFIEKQIREWNPELVHIFNINYSYLIKHQTKKYKSSKDEE
jgi:hypothetical protein